MEKNKFQVNLDQLSEMGFRDRPVNMTLLLQFNEDVLRVVQQLLNREINNSSSRIEHSSNNNNNKIANNEKIVYDQL